VSRLLGTNTNSLKIRHTMQKNMVYLTEKITATTHATIGQLFFFLVSKVYYCVWGCGSLLSLSICAGRLSICKDALHSP
jgi:hypothetical protein